MLTTGATGVRLLSRRTATENSQNRLLRSLVTQSAAARPAREASATNQGGGAPIAMDRLTGQDLYELLDERPNQPRHTLKVLELQREVGIPDLTLEGLRDHVARKLPGLPRFRQQVARAPRPLFSAVWFDAGPPDLAELVHQVDVPPAEGRAGLRRLLERLAAEPLDRDRPLWGLWLVNGAEPDRQVLILKVHHCLAGGSALRRILEHLFAPDPPREWETSEAGTRRALVSEPATGPGRWALTAMALRHVAGLPVRGVRVWRPTVAGLAAVGRLRRQGISEAPAMAAPAMPWNGALGPSREVGFLKLPLDQVRSVAASADCSVTDVLLATTAGALRRYLLARQSLPTVPLTAAVPMERKPDATELGGNTGTSFGLYLATDVADGRARLRVARDHARSAARAHRAAPTAAWMGFHEAYPLFDLSQSLLLALARRRGRDLFSVIVSSVRGPGFLLGIAGHQFDCIYSVGPLAAGIGLNVTAWGYGEWLTLGVVSTPELLDSLDDLMACFGQEAAALPGSP